MPKYYWTRLMKEWQDRHNTIDIFSYRLNIRRCRYLNGLHHFYTELNPERMKLRRCPETILSLRPTFNESNFNFKKINDKERLFTIPYGDGEITLIVNKSPLTCYHTLICPNIEDNHIQLLTLYSLKFCVDFLIAPRTEERHLRIGYNSPGALASVNHLHLHLVYINMGIYIDHAKLVSLSDHYHDVYRLDPSMPTEAICWLIRTKDTDDEIMRKMQQIEHFIKWLCDHNWPHNIFITPPHKNIDHNYIDNDIDLKIFIYVRENFCVNRDSTTINIGFCELSGFVPVGDETIYRSIGEATVIEKIRQVTGNVYAKVYEYFIT